MLPKEGSKQEPNPDFLILPGKQKGVQKPEEQSKRSSQQQLPME